MPRSTTVARLAGTLLILAALALYLSTLTDSLTPGELRGGDPITHTYAQVEGRFSNAPGYPIFTMGGWLWFHGLRPLASRFANPVQILSSYELFWGILALVALYHLLRAVTDNDWPLALLITAFYAVTYFFWFYSISIEEYSSAVLQQILLIWALLRWDETGHHRYLLGVALLGGLSLAHMITVAIIAPPVLWFIFVRRPQLLRQPKMLLVLTGVALLPLLSYSYVYVVGLYHLEWRGTGTWPSTLAWFLDFVSTHQGQGELTWTLGPFTAEFPSLIWQELTWPVLVLGLIGLGFTGKRRAIFFYSTLLIYFIFCYIDRYGNWFQAIMPAYPILLIGLAVLLHRLQRAIAKSRGPRTGTLFYASLLLLLALLVSYRYRLSAPRANMHARPAATGLQSGFQILADDPVPGAGIVAPLDDSLALRYLTTVYALRPDVHPITTTQARQWLAMGSGTVYAVDSAIGIAFTEISPDLHLSDHGQHLVELRLQAQTHPPDLQVRLDRDLLPGLRLLGYNFSRPSPHQLAVSLYWQATGPIAADPAVSLRPLHQGQFFGQNGQLVQQDRPHPVHGQYPFPRWQPGEVVRDDYSFDFASAAQTDGAALILYRPGADGFENLADVRFTLP